MDETWGRKSKEVYSAQVRTPDQLTVQRHGQTGAGTVLLSTAVQGRVWTRYSKVTFSCIMLVFERVLCLGIGLFMLWWWGRLNWEWGPVQNLCVTLDVLLNSSLCAQHPARPNNTKMSEFGAEKILLQGHARKWVAHAAKPFYKKARKRCG